MGVQAKNITVLVGCLLQCCTFQEGWFESLNDDFEA